MKEDKIFFKDVYEKAIEKWGETAQLLQAAEEANEFSRAIIRVIQAKNLFNSKKILRKRELNLIEEIADLEIMIKQVKIIFKEAEEKIKRIREMKLLRTWYRTEEKEIDFFKWLNRKFNYSKEEFEDFYGEIKI